MVIEIYYEVSDDRLCYINYHKFIDCVLMLKFVNIAFCY